MEDKGTVAHKLILLLKDAPRSYLFMLHKMLSSNGSQDWTVGVVRPAMKSTWPMFLTIHLIVGVSGLVAGSWMLLNIVSSKLYRNNTGAYLLSLSINNLFVVLLQLPLTFVVMLYENWVFGAAVCYMAAILPYLLIHCSALTFLVMSVDRFRSIAHPSKRQPNVLICLVTVWVAAICAATPMATYNHYRDLDHVHPSLRNNGMCWSTGDDYSRMVFVAIFTLPAMVTALLTVKTSAELKTKMELCNLHQTQLQQHEDRMYSDTDSSTGENLNEKCKEKEWVVREKTTQKYLTAMACLWVACWLPIKVFGVVHTSTIETEENAELFDVASMVLLPVSALSTVTTPICYAMMRMKLPQKDEMFDSVERPDDSDNKSFGFSSSSSRVQGHFSSFDGRRYI